MTEHTKGHR